MVKIRRAGSVDKRMDKVCVEVRETEMVEGVTHGMTVLIGHAHADRKCATTRSQYHKQKRLYPWQRTGHACLLSV